MHLFAHTVELAAVIVYLVAHAAVAVAIVYYLVAHAAVAVANVHLFAHAVATWVTIFLTCVAT